MDTSTLTTPVPKWIEGCGEYNNWFVGPDGNIYDGSAGVPALVFTPPAPVLGLCGSLHHQGYLDSKGNVAVWGNGENGSIGSISTTPLAVPTFVTHDAKGNPFTNVIDLVAYVNGGDPGGMGNGFIALKSDGTVWVWGNTQMGMAGDGTAGSTAQLLPVQVPGLPFIKQIAGCLCGIALDINGQVWTWGAGADPNWPPLLLGQGTNTPNPLVPGKLVQPGPARFIAGGSFFSYAVLVSNTVIGWGWNTEFLGLSNTPAQTSPFNLDTALALPSPVDRIFVSPTTTYAILQDKTLFGWGDTACGQLGIGKSLDMSKYVNSSGIPAPYNWDWGQMECPQIKPVQIGKGLLFSNVNTGLGAVFYMIAEDVNGNLYFCGRDKGGVGCRGIVAGDALLPQNGTLAAARPNSWDCPWLTPIAPFSLKYAIPVTSPYCLTDPNATECAAIRPMVIPAYKVIAGIGSPVPAASVTQTSGAQLNAAAPAAPIIAWFWTQASGPSTAQIILNTSQNPSVLNLIPGTYVFQVQTTDCNWGKQTAQVTVVVPAIAPPPPPVTQPPSVIKTVTTIIWTQGKTQAATVNYFSDGSTSTQ